jgi:hypothetical protein
MTNGGSGTFTYVLIYLYFQKKFNGKASFAHDLFKAARWGG